MLPLRMAWGSRGFHDLRAQNTRGVRVTVQQAFYQVRARDTSHLPHFKA